MGFLKVAIIFFVIIVIIFVISFIIDYPIIVGLIVLFPLLIRWLVNKKAKKRLDSLHSKDVEDDKYLGDFDNFDYEYVKEEYTLVSVYGGFTYQGSGAILELLPLEDIKLIEEKIFKNIVTSLSIFNGLSSATKIRPIPVKMPIIAEECAKNEAYREKVLMYLGKIITENNVGVISDIDGKQLFYFKVAERYLDENNISYANTPEKLDFLKNLILN